MATLRVLPSPPELSSASPKVLSPDGRTVACRLEGEKAGLYLFDVEGAARPFKLDAAGRRYVDPRWSAFGDLLFRVESPAGSFVAAAPAFGRGSAIEHPGSGIAVSADGRVLVVADPAGATLRVAVAKAGSPFHEPLQEVARLAEADPGVPADLDLTPDGSHVLMIRRTQGAPSLWAYPSAGGDAQEIVPDVAAPASLAFSTGKGQLAVFERRESPQPTSRVFVRPMSAGSLGLVRLGPARDVAFGHSALPLQRAALSRDGKRLAVVSAIPGEVTERALELVPASGGKPTRVVRSSEILGYALFLDSGEIAIHGADRVAVVTL